MKFCQPHWDSLKKAIAGRGLNDFVSKDGHEALSREVGQLECKPSTRRNFDPLMGAHWAIINRAMELIGKVGANPLALLGDNSEHPERDCPICYLNYLSEEHDRTCTEVNCKKVKGLRFDDWIDGVADHMKDVVESLPE